MAKIVSMICELCKTDTCEFMLCTDAGDMYIDKNGLVVSSEHPHIKVGDSAQKILRSMTVQYTLGSCNIHEDEATFTTTFDDGSVFLPSRVSDALVWLVITEPYDGTGDVIKPKQVKENIAPVEYIEYDRFEGIL